MISKAKLLKELTGGKGPLTFKHDDRSWAALVVYLVYSRPSRSHGRCIELGRRTRRIRGSFGAG
jgi:hypothetical protein